MAEQQLSKVWVVIPAAGIGSRMQSSEPKQYHKVLGKTILEHTLNCFLGHPEVAGVVVVLNADDLHWRKLNIKSDTTPLFTIIGGSHRSDSVMQGLKYLTTEQHLADDSWVMIHDAARPCLSENDLDSLLAIREMSVVGGLLASPVNDTMKRSEAIKNPLDVKDNLSDHCVINTESRENLWHALTPQMFRLRQLTSALHKCQDNNIEVTDESSALEFIGEQPILIKCEDKNIKVTHPSDIPLASFLMSFKKTIEENA